MERDLGSRGCGWLSGSSCSRSIQHNGCGNFGSRAHLSISWRDHPSMDSTPIHFIPYCVVVFAFCKERRVPREVDAFSISPVSEFSPSPPVQHFDVFNLRKRVAEDPDSVCRVAGSGTRRRRTKFGVITYSVQLEASNRQVLVKILTRAPILGNYLSLAATNFTTTHRVYSVYRRHRPVHHAHRTAWPSNRVAEQHSLPC
jgi:hypothetical protein